MLFPTFSSNPFLHNRANRILWPINLLAIIAMIVFIFFKFPPQVDTINLGHNIYFGISQIGEWWQIYYLPLYALIITLLNFTLATIFYKKNATAAYVLASIATLAQLIIATQIFLTMLLNVS